MVGKFEKYGQSGFLIAIVTTVISVTVLKMPDCGSVSLLHAAPQPEWYPVPEPVPSSPNRADTGSIVDESVAQAGFWSSAGQENLSIIHVSAALNALSGALEERDDGMARPLFGTTFDWQASRSSASLDSLGSAIPLPPILDGSRSGRIASLTDEGIFNGVDLTGTSLTSASHSFSDPFQDVGEEFVEEVPQTTSPMAALYQPGPQPTPAPLIPPPLTDEEPEKREQKAAAELLFQKRMGELNRSMAGIQLGYPSEKGVFPPNQAAELASEQTPLLITGAGGWFEPRPNRYPVPFAYQPLYFEEMNLERCGIGYGFFQPFCSSAAFVKNTITLPYQLVAHSPHSLVETPGDCPSCHRFPCRCK